MKPKYLISCVQVVFGDIPSRKADVLIVGDRIVQIAKPNSLSPIGCTVIDGKERFLLPGGIDSQVHFREPGLIHKATIATEARAAVRGGITSYMEMPNTDPAATTVDLLEKKYSIAEKDSLANYSFFMGTTSENLDELLKVNPKTICGIKIFMGSSTGNMLVGDRNVLEKIFSAIGGKILIATHCEDDILMNHNLESAKAQYGDENLTAEFHPIIRNEDVCYNSSAFAVELAQKYGVRLHVLHISTAKELSLFRNDIPLEYKQITAEVCVHHLTFCDADYATLGNLIRCNPAIKKASDREMLWGALLDDRLDVISTDHAPHTWEEKDVPYLKAPSGVPFVQHGLQMMIQHHLNGKISLQQIVQKMCNNQATLFNIKDRGFIREGYYADLALVDLTSKMTVSKDNILYKCGWSPLEGKVLNSNITHVWVNGHMAYCKGTFDETKMGERLVFDR